MTRARWLWLAAAGIYAAVLVLALVRDADSWLWFVYGGALVIGLVSGRWIAAALALVVVPSVALGVLFDGDEPVGDAGSGPLESAAIALVFVVAPAALVIGLGVGLRRVVDRMRGRREPAL